MDSKGQLIAKFGQSKSIQFVWYFLAIIIASAGVLVLSLIPQITSGKMNFSGDISLLYMVGFGALAFATAIIGLTIILMRTQSTFEIYEYAIRSTGKKGERLDYYTDIEDIFLFLYGGFGYRVNPSEPWIFAGAKTSQYAKLASLLRERQSIQRAEKLYEQLRQGEKVIFRCFSNQDALSKSVAATRNLNFPVDELVLSQKALQFRGQTILLDQLADIKTNFWIERTEIIDVNGNSLLKLHPAAVLSFDLLCKLIARLQDDIRQSV